MKYVLIIWALFGTWFMISHPRSKAANAYIVDKGEQAEIVQACCSQGPTMFMITNALECAPTPDGPWTQVDYSWTKVVVIPGTKFYRARLYSGASGLP